MSDGGAAFAFPHFRIEKDGGVSPVVYPEKGMTLRDYFAAAALQGYIAARYDCHNEDALAKYAYEFADAMLKARDQK